MTDEEVKILYCHKDLTQFCKRAECPMWFIPPNPEADGDCAEALNEKQAFWEVIKQLADEMALKAEKSA
mgnify:CR=1 FL=1